MTVTDQLVDVASQVAGELFQMVDELEQIADEIRGSKGDIRQIRAIADRMRHAAEGLRMEVDQPDNDPGQLAGHLRNAGRLLRRSAFIIGTLTGAAVSGTTEAATAHVLTEQLQAQAEHCTVAIDQALEKFHDAPLILEPGDIDLYPAGDPSLSTAIPTPVLYVDPVTLAVTSSDGNLWVAGSDTMSNDLPLTAYRIEGTEIFHTATAYYTFESDANISSPNQLQIYSDGQPDLYLPLTEATANLLATSLREQKNDIDREVAYDSATQSAADTMRGK